MRDEYDFSKMEARRNPYIKKLGLSINTESNIKVLEESAANIKSGKSIPKEHDLIEE